MRLKNFLETINEAKFRQPKVMYHGTSSEFLRTILKQGIVPDPKQKMWDKDPDVGKSSLSRESLSGSYWSSNLGTATSSAWSTANKFGGNTIVVIALIAEGSALADEDDVGSALLRGFGNMYQELFRQGIVMEELPRVSSLAYWGFDHQNNKNHADEMLQSYAKHVHAELSANANEQPIPMELMKGLLESMMLRGLAYTKEIETGKYNSDPYVKEIERLAEEGKAPQIPPLAEMEQTLLGIRDKLTRYYRKTTIDTGQFAHTLRTEEPVTYRGANRIIGIIMHAREMGDPRVLYYGTLPDDYKEQYRQRVGPNRGIVDPKGNVLEPSEEQDEPAQVAASVGMTEARTGRRYYLEGPNGEHFMYPSSAGTFPSTVLIPIDTQDLKTATNIVAARFNPRNMKKLIYELTSPSSTVPRTVEQETILRIYQEAINDRNMRPYLNMMHEMPYTQLIELDGRDRIYKYIITDLKQQVATFQSIFGEVPELGESHFTPFHNAQLFVPDNMRPANKKIALTVLEDVYNKLQRIGADAVFGGHIIIMPLKADGEYVAKTGEIRMNANTKNPERAAVVLLHEYGHKLQYEHMTPEQNKMLRTKYVELLREGESHMGNVDLASEVEHLASQIEIGMPVKYVGRGKKGWGSNPNYVVVAFGKTAKGTPGVTIADDDSRKFVRGTIGFPSILNPKRWKLPFEGITTQQQLAHSKPSDEWFPTKYSMTDEDEWWAELFSFYAMGNLKGEPAVWVNKFLSDFGKQKVAASVGGNEGETWEEPDQTDGDMNPKEIVPKSNALADEGTSSGWDWTDPQHGTAPDNAVMSHTP